MRLWALLLGLVPGIAWGDPGTVWNELHTLCVPHEMEHAGPAPCAAVDLANHYVVIKDKFGVAQYLLLPTDRMPGIESPLLLRKETPNFWGFAWAARSYVIAKAPRKLTDADIGLAINPPWDRNQNQLHIHIDCVKAAVQDQLRGLTLTDAWTPVTLQGVIWDVRGFDVRKDPFFVVEALAARDHSSLGDWSVGSVGPDVLLATRKAAAEDLLDHACR